MTSDDIVITTAADDADREFFDPSLLTTEYFVKYRRSYDKRDPLGASNPFRNYVSLLNSLTRIFEYKEPHARSFAKRLKAQQRSFNACEAIFAEILVYAYYVPLVGEGAVSDLDLQHDDYDLRIARPDGTAYYFEIFSVMPNRSPDSTGVVTIKSHLQDEMASIRQKLLRKIQKQSQMTKDRENWAVIELNDVSIAGDFAVLSSLSSGYKVNLRKADLALVDHGYDWNDSAFEDEATNWLKGVIWFDLGNYPGRRMLLNPAFKSR